MNKEYNIKNLTQAFEEFTLIIDKFEKNHKILESKIDFLSSELQNKNIELEHKIEEKNEIHNFLENILESIYSGVIVVNKKGQITVFNKAAETITGFSKKEVINKKYSSIMKNTSPSFDKSAIYTLSSKKESHHREKIIRTMNGEEKNIEFSTSLIIDPKGEISGVAEIINDISELKKLQNRITHIETLAALGEMAASVAHEIRNPLAGIGGFAGLLERQISKDDSRRRLVEPIINGVNRLNNIVSNLLTYTRPHNLKIQNVDLHKLINELLHFFKISISNEKKQVKLNKNYAEQKIELMLDSQLFQQVLMNLIKNGYEAIVDKGILEINTKLNIPVEMNEILGEEEKNELIRYFSTVEIEIIDNGYGISNEVIPKLFNPFFTTKDNGNGLGLSICQRIIQLHQGEIHVESEIGVGTKFTIILPMYGNYE